MTASSITSTSLKRLSLDSGRVSMIFTTSPILAVLFSSCALYFFVYLIRLWYKSCFLYVSTATTIVLSILSLTTLPISTLRALRSLMFGLLPDRDQTHHDQQWLAGYS